VKIYLHLNCAKGVEVSEKNYFSLIGALIGFKLADRVNFIKKCRIQNSHNFEFFLLNTLVSLCGCQIRTFCPKSGRWGKPELSLPIWIRILNETFWRPSGTKGPRAILFTTPLRQTRKDPGNPDPTLGCRNGVVFKIDLGPFVTDEGRQKRARLKIRIQSGRESSGLPQRPDLGQNVRIWQAQRLTKVFNKKNSKLWKFWILHLWIKLTLSAILDA
jgi:hypothetical protein